MSDDKHNGQKGNKYNLQPPGEGVVERNPLPNGSGAPLKEVEMSFLDHLEELRWHLLRAFSAIFVFAILAFAFPSIVFNTVILGPSRPDFITFEMLCRLSAYLDSDVLCIKQLPFTIQSRQMTGQFSMHVLSSIVIGLVCAFPYAFWEIWRFVKPGLHTHERNLSRGATFFVTLLFLIGVFFGYFIVSPLAVNFLANYQVDPSIINEFDITSYVSTLSMIVLAGGVMFQLPMVVYFLTKAGVVTPAIMRMYRKHAIVIIMIISAVITPPDPITQLFIAFPIILLYQLSILISARIVRRLAKERAAFMQS